MGWWFACLSGLWARIVSSVPWADRTVVVILPDGRAVLRRRGSERPVGSESARRLGRRHRVVLRPSAEWVLACRRVVPAASERDVEDMLRHELPRITPFAAEAVVWRWEAARASGTADRIAVTVTMVPLVALAPVLSRLRREGIRPDAVELAGVSVRLGPAAPRSRAAPALAGVCVLLAGVALMFPVLLQEMALRRTEAAVAALRPAVAAAAALRAGMTQRQLERTKLALEAARVGDLLEGLVRLTDVLPDDTVLTNLVVQGRRLTLSGRSASAARLISILAADPAIREPAFAAPVLRQGGVGGDIFAISAGLTR